MDEPAARDVAIFLNKLTYSVRYYKNTTLKKGWYFYNISKQRR
jgi:hypothetical protein